MLLFYILISILSGVSIVVARTVNSNLAEKLGLLEGTFYNFLTGLMLSIILLIINWNNEIVSQLINSQIPLWAYLGGLFGIGIVLLSNYVIPRVSAFYVTILVFLGQLLIGYVIDYFTIGTVSMTKLLGGLLVLIGMSYNLYVDNAPESKKRPSERMV
jgi:transporter family-2 protein